MKSILLVTMSACCVVLGVTDRSPMANAEAVVSPNDIEIERRYSVCFALEEWIISECLRLVNEYKRGAIAETSSDTEPVSKLLPSHYDEFHVLGIHEPLVSSASNGNVQNEAISVKIDRPGKSVALLLGSNDPSQWVLHPTPGTRIAYVILKDSDARSTVSLNGDVFDAYRIFGESVPFVDQGREFYSFYDSLSNSLGVQRLDSFQGSYRAPEAGFEILKASRLETSDEVSSRLFDDAIDPLDLPLKLRSALLRESSASDMEWVFDDTGFVGYHMNGFGNHVTFALPDSSPRIGASVGPAYDSDGQVLWGLSMNPGLLFEYNIKFDRWKIRSTNRFRAAGMLYDSDAKMLVLTPGSANTGQYVLMDTDAKTIVELEFPWELYPGLTDFFSSIEYSRLKMEPIAIDGTKVLVRSNMRTDWASTASPYAVYLVDLSDKNVRFLRWD